jgi:hypothetical protein
MRATTSHQLQARGLRALHAALVLGGLIAATALGTPGSAEARVPPGATGAEAEFCRSYQNIYDNLVRELSLAVTPAERESLRRQIQRVQNVWDYRCKERFGLISRDVVLAGDVVAAPGVLTQAP